MRDDCSEGIHCESPRIPNDQNCVRVMFLRVSCFFRFDFYECVMLKCWNEAWCSGTDYCCFALTRSPPKRPEQTPSARGIGLPDAGAHEDQCLLPSSCMSMFLGHVGLSDSLEEMVSVC